MTSRQCQQRVISLQRSIKSAKQAVGEAAQRLADAQVPTITIIIITISTIAPISTSNTMLTTITLTFFNRLVF